MSEDWDGRPQSDPGGNLQDEGRLEDEVNQDEGRLEDEVNQGGGHLEDEVNQDEGRLQDGGHLEDEVNQGGGKPRPYISRNASADTRNVGAGLAPARQISPTLQTSSALQTPSPQNPTLQAFLEGLSKLGLELTEQQLDQFLWYRQELLDWNTRINLTAITDPEEVLIKHFLDSLSL